MPDVSPLSPLWPEEPGWTYGSVLPLARDPAGKLHFVAPDMLHQAVNDLGVALRLPGAVASGQMTLQQAAPLVPQATMGLMGAGLGTSSLLEAGPALGSFRGYHGTPYRFEPVEGNPFGEFRNEAIGSGEGAQAYGWGHYVAGNPKVAEMYKSNLTDKAFINKVRDIYGSDYDPEEAEAVLAANKGQFSGPEQQLMTALKNDGWLGFDYPHQAVSAALKHPEYYDLSPETQKALDNLGSLYHVEIKPDEHELLDWDKPLAASPDVFEKLKSNFPDLRSEDKGVEAYRVISQSLGSSEAASAALHEAGIPGIKYLDQGSRGKPESEATRNYVIFHPSNLKIVGRNGETLGLEPVDHNPFTP